MFAYCLKVFQTELKWVRYFKQAICSTIWGRSSLRLGDYKKKSYAASENTPVARLALYAASENTPVAQLALYAASENTPVAQFAQ